MARKSFEKALVRVLVSFNGMRAGDTSEVEMTPRVYGWADAGLIEVTWDGEDQAGSGGAESDSDECEQVGVEGGGPSSGEPSEGFGSGAYGAFA